MPSVGFSLALTRGASYSSAFVNVLTSIACVRGLIVLNSCKGVVFVFSRVGFVNVVDVCVVGVFVGFSMRVAGYGCAGGVGMLGFGLHSGSGSSPSSCSKSPKICSGARLSFWKTTCGVMSCDCCHAVWKSCMVSSVSRWSSAAHLAGLE